MQVTNYSLMKNTFTLSDGVVDTLRILKQDPCEHLTHYISQAVMAEILNQV